MLPRVPVQATAGPDSREAEQAYAVSLGRRRQAASGSAPAASKHAVSFVTTPAGVAPDKTPREPASLPRGPRGKQRQCAVLPHLLSWDSAAKGQAASLSR